MVICSVKFKIFLSDRILNREFQQQLEDWACGWIKDEIIPQIDWVASCASFSQQTTEMSYTYHTMWNIAHR